MQFPLVTVDCFRNGCDRQGSPDNIINPIRSSRITSWESFRFKYGILEARAKIPAGDWIWPAIWFYPKNDSIYGGWPVAGEIDLMESRGNREMFQEGVNTGVQQVGSTLHFGPNWEHNGKLKSYFIKILFYLLTAMLTFNNLSFSLVHFIRKLKP